MALFSRLYGTTNTLVGTYLMLADNPLSPSDDHLIPKLSRHNVFLAYAHGAKFLIIWSLFKRTSVFGTYIWYISHTILWIRQRN
jgi:hypothetical protein